MTVNPKNPNENTSVSSTSNTVVSFPIEKRISAKPYALIIGINSSIGLALAKEYTITHQVVGTARDITLANHHFTLVQTTYAESDLPELFTTLSGISSEYTVIINCIGLLHNAIVKPEKSLDKLNERSLSEYFRVNATIPALLLKTLVPLLPKKKVSVFATLSAMIGSISDNKLGGWYGYRASKAALNMLIKTTSVELTRSHPHAAVIALHPGTTRSKLSAPFTKNLPEERLYSPKKTAKRLKRVIDSTNASKTGLFFHWSGNQLEW